MMTLDEQDKLRLVKLRLAGASDKFIAFVHARLLESIDEPESNTDGWREILDGFEVGKDKRIGDRVYSYDEWVKAWNTAVDYEPR